MSASIRSIRIENRRPTLAEVNQICDLLNRSFGTKDYDEGFFYITPQIYRFYCDTPQQDDAAYFMAFDKTSEKIVGFFTVGCRNYTIFGKGPFKVGEPTLLAVENEYQGQGIGKLMGTFVTNLYNQYSYFAGYQTFEENSRGLKSVPEKNREKFLKMKRIETIYFRPLNMNNVLHLMNLKWYEKIGIRLIQGTKPVIDPRIREFNCADSEKVIQLLNQYANEMDFALFWDLQYFQWYVQQSNVRVRVFEENNEIKGILMAIILQFQIKGKVVPLAMMENYRFQEIPPNDRIRFVKSFIFDLAKEGTLAIIDYGLGYQPLEAFKKNRFLPQKRTFTFYLEPHVQSEIYNKKPKDEWRIYTELR